MAPPGKVAKPQKNGKANKGGKKGAKGSGKKSKGSFKARKVPTLKQKNARESKVVKLDSLSWKPVEIPDNFNDFSGAYGLEELEGVHVEMIDGKPRFTVKEDKADEEDVADVARDEEADVVEAEEEFAGFDDEMEDVEENDGDEVADKAADKNNEDEVVADDGKDSTQETLEDLKSNTFTYNVPLPDDNVTLPAWEEHVTLSVHTLNALQQMGFSKPTEIQKEAIAPALQGHDVIGKATTGSGKTLAFGIPLLEHYLSREKTDAPSGIIFSPTRELAHQVTDHINKLAKYSPLSQHGIVLITGGLSIQKQERLLSHNPGIIVATPGRFLELLEKDLELARKMSRTNTLVLDEADRLLQDGHFEEFAKILEILEKNRPKLREMGGKWQTLVFLATFAKELFSKLEKHQKKAQGMFNNEEIIKLLDSKLHFQDKKPVLIDASPKEVVSGQVTEALVECGPLERDLYLYYFVLMYPGSTLVFANSIDSVKRLVPLLSGLGIPAFAIHSAMIQKQRLRALERFNAARAKQPTAVLVASDVAARGLDIPNIDHVVHYHLPRTADVYVHRSGRTARAGREGVSVMLCSPQEASGPLRKLRKLVANNAPQKMNMRADVNLLPIEMSVLGQLRPRVEILQQLADAGLLQTATRKEDSWVKQAAEDLGIDDETFEDMDRFEDDIIKKQRKRKESKMLSKEQQKQLRFRLKEMMAVPIRKSMRRSYLTSGLENLAHQIVSGQTHKEVLGHETKNALDVLRKKKLKKN